MKHYYCAADGGFYIAGIHPHIPASAAEISQNDYQALLADQSAGKLIVAGEDGLPRSVMPEQALTTEQRMLRMRNERDARLLASDYLMLPDYPLSAEQRAAWAAYRQALRDLPDTLTDPADIHWPVPPTGADT